MLDQVKKKNTDKQRVISKWDIYGILDNTASSNSAQSFDSFFRLCFSAISWANALQLANHAHHS